MRIGYSVERNFMEWNRYEVSQVRMWRLNGLTRSGRSSDFGADFELVFMRSWKRFIVNMSSYAIQGEGGKV